MSLAPKTADVIALARAGRFSPRLDGADVPVERLQLVVPACIAESFAVGKPATARDIGLLWRIIYEEGRVWAARNVNDEVEKPSLASAVVTRDILRRGSERAAIESLARLTTATFCVEGIEYGPILTNASVEGPRKKRALRWDLAARLLTSVRNTSLQGRRVEPFSRVELQVALRANSRWTAPIYTRLIQHSIKYRQVADVAGWSTVAIDLGHLARSIGWPGASRRMHDFLHQVVRPAMMELSAGGCAMPRQLNVELQPLASSDRSATTITVRLRRLNRLGLPLDKVPLPTIAGDSSQILEAGQDVCHAALMNGSTSMRTANGKRQGFVTRLTALNTDEILPGRSSKQD